MPEAALRTCPICERRLYDPICSADLIGTILVDPPRVDIESVRAGWLMGGRYAIRDRIGCGGYGAVFEAQHVGTGQPVAVKVLARERDRAGSMTLVRRFFMEARVTAGLRHPNTVRVFDFGQDESGLLYLAMERLRGRTLRDEITSRKGSGVMFTEQQVIDIGIAVARSLSEAHRAGLVHRDLKPNNLFRHDVEGEEPVLKVLDFGLVKLLDTARLTEVGAMVGTPAYMSPEQALGRDVDEKSDFYSLGLILFELMSGAKPFYGKNPVEMARARIVSPAPDIRSIAPASDELAAVLGRMLARYPEDRFTDAAEMRAALESIRSGRSKSFPKALAVSLALMAASAIAIADEPDVGARHTDAPLVKSAPRFVVEMAPQRKKAPIKKKKRIKRSSHRKMLDLRI